MMTEHYTTIRQRFDRHAGQYLRNPITHWVGRSELSALKEMMPPRKQNSENLVLDFGCGTGRVTAMLLEMKYKVTGYDLSPGMLERARSTLGANPDVVFTSDPQTLHNQWPLIVALGVLDYYTDSTPLWSEWKRLLTPGGTLLVTAPNARSPLAWFYTFLSRFTCQAYTTTPEKLMPFAQAHGFSLIGQKTVFPQRPWGHTLVLGFQLNRS
jgi:SAM-dependent methyltransferase